MILDLSLVTCIAVDKTPFPTPKTPVILGNVQYDSVGLCLIASHQLDEFKAPTSIGEHPKLVMEGLTSRRPFAVAILVAQKAPLMVEGR